MHIPRQFTAILFLVSISLTTAQASQIRPVGQPVWNQSNPFQFQITCKNTKTNETYNNVLFSCAHQEPHKYILLNRDHFPKLDLSNTESRQTYLERMTAYVNQLKLTRREYEFKGVVANRKLSYRLMLPHQLPLPCTLDTCLLQENYEMGRMDLSQVLVKLGGTTVLLDISPKLREAFGIVPLVKLRTAADANLSQIVCARRDLNGSVFNSVGSIFYYQKPQITGIYGFEKAPEEIKSITYSMGAMPYEETLASCILSPQSEAGFIDLGELGNGDESEDEHCFSEASSTSSKGEWDESSHGNEDVFELYQHFKLIGHEKQGTSPYIYNDGNGLFLTETFGQDCLPLIKGEADSAAAHTLRYTLATLYPVQVSGLSNSNPKGLYQLEGDSWMRVNDFYEAQDMFPAQKVGSHGVLMNTVMSQTQSCGLKSTLQNMGVIADYVELMGSAKFQQLLNQFQGNTTGLLRTVTALGPDEQHLIVPLLLILRELPHLKDDELIHKGSYINDTGGNISPSAWKYWRQDSYKNLHQFLKLEGYYYVWQPLSLKLLPLISMQNGQTRIGAGEWNTQTCKPIPFGLGTEAYQDVAQFLSMDQFSYFDFSLTHEHESDMELTIQPMARAIRYLKNLKTFNFPPFIGIKNLEYLIDRGLCQNSSITNLIYSGIYGEYPVALMGRVLAKNTTVKSLEMGMYNIVDLACLNELGHGLEKNKTVTDLQFQITFRSAINPLYGNRMPDWLLTQGSNNHWEDQPRRPLPGRSRESRTHDFSVFRDALIESNVNNITIRYSENCKGQSSSVDAFVNMIKGVDKPGLVKHIY